MSCSSRPGALGLVMPDSEGELAVLLGLLRPIAWQIPAAVIGGF